jgi:hypothetical protein
MSTNMWQYPCQLITAVCIPTPRATVDGSELKILGIQVSACTVVFIPPALKQHDCIALQHDVKLRENDRSAEL